MHAHSLTAAWPSHGDAAPLQAKTDPDGAGAEPPVPPVEVGLVELAGSHCRVMKVDGLVPRHSAHRSGRRMRLSYLPQEIAHFEWSGHRYALVPAAEAPAAPSPADGGHGEAPTDIARLLTQREMQIVQLICLGFLTKQVADRLHLSEFTVRSYLKSTYAKLGVRSRAALVFRYTQAFQGPVSRDARS